MSRSGGAPNWSSLLESWDAQQESFHPDRERRFDAMFQALEASLPKRFTALDLGCGPGSLSLRLLRRFPGARVIAVDYDPVTLRIGREALGDLGGRLTWVDANLGSPGWTERLPRRRVEAVVSTTALHWLTAPRLRSLYRDLAHLLPRGGVFLDGDYFPWGARRRELRRLTWKVWQRRASARRSTGGWDAWRRWWTAAEKIPALRAEFAERKRRHAVHPKHDEASLEVHEDALRRAGFREVGVVWEDFGDRVLFARR